MVHLLQLLHRHELKPQHQHLSFAVQLELLQPSILDSGFGLDSMVGSDSMIGLSAHSESVVGFYSVSSVGSALEMLDGFESAHSTTEECFYPAILQSTEDIFQHYVHWPHCMYIVHEGTPSNSV